MNQPTVRLPLPTLAGGTGLGVLAGTAAGAAAAWFLGSTSLGGAAMAGLVVAVASVAGLAIVWLGGERGGIGLAAVVIAASSVRMLLALALGAAVFIARNPDRASFWAALVLAAFAVLAVETRIAMSALKRAGGRGVVQESGG